MARLKVVALAFMAVFMLGAIAAASASALALPEFTVETKLESKFGKSKLNVSGAEIKSTEGGSNLSQSELVNKSLGKTTIWFKKSTLGGFQCHTSGDANENILVPVEWHVVPPKTGGDELIAFLITENVEIKCTIATVTVLKGSIVIGKIGPIGSKGKTFTLEVNAPGGSQEITEYENNAGEKVKGTLKVKVGSTEATGSQEDEAATVTTEKETELLES